MLHALCSSTGVDVLPDLPTAVEAGIEPFKAAAWYSLLVLRGLPARIKGPLSESDTTFGACKCCPQGMCKFALFVVVEAACKY